MQSDSEFDEDDSYDPRECERVDPRRTVGAWGARARSTLAAFNTCWRLVTSGVGTEGVRRDSLTACLGNGVWYDTVFGGYRQ
jgi:hypothetical protein